MGRRRRGGAGREGQVGPSGSEAAGLAAVGLGNEAAKHEDAREGRRRHKWGRERTSGLGPAAGVPADVSEAVRVSVRASISGRHLRPGKYRPTGCRCIPVYTHTRPSCCMRLSPRLQHALPRARTPHALPRPCRAANCGLPRGWMMFCGFDNAEEIAQHIQQARQVSARGRA